MSFDGILFCLIAPTLNYSTHYLAVKKVFRTFASFSGMRGLQKSLILFSKSKEYMIDKSVVRTTVEEWLQGNDYFLVDLVFGSDDRIIVEIDHADGVWIEDCASLSRYMQEKLGDALGDYELEVGSAGIGQPFKVAQQYINYIGEQVEVLTADGKKVQGVLKSVDGTHFVVSVQEKQKLEGKKRPVMVEVDKDFDMNEVKYTKYLLNFK